MSKRAKSKEELGDSSSSSDEDDRGKFESAIDPAFSGTKQEGKAKSDEKLTADIDEPPVANNDKYADQRKHLSKKLAQYLDSVIEYSDESSSKQEKKALQKTDEFLLPPKNIRLFSCSTAALPSTEAELDRRKRQEVLETEAHNKRAKEIRLKRQQESDDDAASSSGDDKKRTSKKKKKSADDVKACVVSVEPFPSSTK